MTDVIAKLLGSWAEDLNLFSIAFRIALSVIFSAVIGCERANKRHSAGLRTFIIVTLSGTVAIILDIYIAKIYGSKLFLLSVSAVISATIISVNSLFFSSRNQIRGLTTSAGLCSCCFIGIAIGGGFYTLALVGMLALLVEL